MGILRRRTKMTTQRESHADLLRRIEELQRQVFELESELSGIRHTSYVAYTNFPPTPLTFQQKKNS